MLGIGFFEVVIIAIVCLIALGPKQLPGVMREIALFYKRLLSFKQEIHQLLEQPELLLKDDPVLENKKPPEDKKEFEKIHG
jgi:sec-independent protein translocase protein TatB